MSVTAISDRTRTAARGPRRSATHRPPVVTVTVDFPLTSDGLPRGAARLLAAIRELAAELGEGAVRVYPPAESAAARYSPPTAGVAAAGPAPAAVVDLVAAHQAATLATARLDGILYVHPAARTVVCDGRQLRLTRLEFDLLLFLAEHPDQVFRRDELLRGVWGYDQTGVRTVDVHVRRLRVKLGTLRPLVATVHGVGYRLDDRARIRILRETAPEPSA